MPTRLATTVFAFIACCALPTGIACAQANGIRSGIRTTGFAIQTSGGFIDTAVRDEANSPLRFSGKGPLGRLVAEYTGTRWSFQLGAEGTRSALTSIVGARQQQIMRGARGDLAVTRSMTSTKVIDVDVGVRASGTVSGIHNSFGETDLASTTFRVSTFTLGPYFITDARVRTGSARLQLALPAVGAIDRPYSAVKFAEPSFRPVIVHPGRMRAFETTLSYTMNPKSRVAAGIAWRTRYLAVEDTQPLRSYTSSVLLSMTTRFTGAAR